jgi:hypothetical protein
MLRDVPEGWTERDSRRLAVATHAVVSALIGEMGAGRTSIPAALRALAGMAAARIVVDQDSTGAHGEDDDDVEAVWHGQQRRPVVVEPSPWPEWASERVQRAIRESRAAGWGGKTAPWRRIAGAKFQQVRPAPGEPDMFVVDAPDDYQAVDSAWRIAKAASRKRPLLPLRLCSAFVPPARTLLLDDLEQPLQVEMPSAWQLIAQLVVWGPEAGQERLIAWIASRAEEVLPPRADRPEGGRHTSGAMDGLVRCARVWFLAIRDVAPAFNGVLDEWQRPIELDGDRIADGVDAFMDRTAIPLHVFRRGLTEARLAFSGYVRGDGTMRDGWFLHLRFALVLGMLGDLACRPSELARVCPGDIREGFFEDPETGLRVAVTEVRVIVAAKGGERRGRRRRSRQPRWKPIHPDTAADLRLWLALTNVSSAERRPIWVASPGGQKRMTGDALSAVLKSTSCGIPRLPRLTGRAYTADNVRHMASLLAQDVGHAWLHARPSALSQVSAYAFSEALLCHQPRSDMLGYMDVKTRPELWGARAALGAPSVPGTLALIHEDAGARLGWDILAIQKAALELELATAQAVEIQRQIAKLELDEDAITQAMITPRVPGGEVSDAEFRRIMLAREAAKEDRDRALWKVQRELRSWYTEVEVAVGRRAAARAAISHLEATGRTHALDDREPTRLELEADMPDGERRVALDEETWEQALDRAKLRITLVLDQPVPGPPPIRHILNLREFAAVLGMTDRALRDRLSGRASALFPLSGPSSPLVGEGKLRSIDVDKLPEGLKRRLLPEQLEMIEQFCAVRMGSTWYGGRRD